MIDFGYAEEIRLLASTSGNDDLYNYFSMEDAFNEYSMKNNLNITINIDLVKYEKPTDSYAFFKHLIESLLKKQKSTFDIYFYNTKYINIYGTYLLDLYSKLPKENIERFNPKVLHEECTYKNELVGLVISNNN